MEPPFPGMDPYLEASHRWPDVHIRLIAAICDSIQAQLNPGYIAVITPYIALESVEISSARQAIVPDVAVLRHGPLATEEGGAVAIAEPPLRLPAPMVVPTRYARIEIRSVTNEQLVTAIELLSPANKRPGADGADAYEKKRQELFSGHVHLLEIDLLRGGSRPRVSGALPPAAYFIFLGRAARWPMIDIWPIELHERIPVVPVPLIPPDPDVALDINRILHQVYRNARYDRQISYAEPPPPPELSPADSAWLAGLLRERGLRG